jgi:Uma2 family endonuclease
LPTPLSPDHGDIERPPTNLKGAASSTLTDFQIRQSALLLESLEYAWCHRQDFYAASHQPIIFSLDQLESQQPLESLDFFVVLGTDRTPRQHWIVWAEGGRYPHVIIDFSQGNAITPDPGLTKPLYQDIFRTPEYFWFEPYTSELRGFQLFDVHYQPISPNHHGMLWSKQLNLFLGTHDRDLRFFNGDAKLIPTLEETASKAKSATEQADALLARYQEHFFDLRDL